MTKQEKDLLEHGDRVCKGPEVAIRNTAQLVAADEAASWVPGSQGPVREGFGLGAGF